MPWKRCPRCSGFSYTAATNPISWRCPYCEYDLSDLPCTPVEEVNEEMAQDQENVDEGR